LLDGQRYACKKKVRRETIEAEAVAENKPIIPAPTIELMKLKLASHMLLFPPTIAAAELLLLLLLKEVDGRTVVGAGSGSSTLFGLSLRHADVFLNAGSGVSVTSWKSDMGRSDDV